MGHIPWRLLLLTAFVGSLLILSGCSAPSTETMKAPDLKNVVDKVQGFSKSEVANRLKEALQKKIDETKAKNDKLVNPDGTINWDEMGRTELVDLTIASILDWEYKATVQANGAIEVKQVDKRTGETKVFATYTVQFVNGQLTVN
ncbi:hypothetical protein GTO89_10245 [Heliobacterium gestii]|uniref:Lipoprotein n=1 Tax=Heliomicrobium gestii TaxID=2699 RepID=A0A845LFP1_HELGE|nr:hypothetical protein [Heliomicrobium gestii]MBM7867168.1 hypothetical protein [Heliomicrobium gestii]MZP43419.1 hypothetical protein [Heliomicrobium gestii]